MTYAIGGLTNSREGAVEYSKKFEWKKGGSVATFSIVRKQEGKRRNQKAGQLGE